MSASFGRLGFEFRVLAQFGLQLDLGRSILIGCDLKTV